MSFSSLPTELVCQVIESSVPSTFHSSTHKERQTTLRSLCLTSRRFLPIAQPMLFEIIFVRDTTSLDAALDSSTALSLSTAILRVLMQEKADATFDKSTRDPPTPWILNWRQIVTSSPVSVPLPASATRLEGTDILELLPQLDVLSLDFLVWSAMSASFREVAAVKTLVDCNNFSTITTVLESPSNARHLRLLNSSSVNPQEGHNKLAEALSNCAKVIGDGARTNISTLYLDNFTSTSGIACHNDQEAFDNLLQASRTQGVEIVWEGAPVDFIIDPVISPEHWRRQRERRRLKRDQA
ncbi:hypothetical protein JCM5353_006986 [Sporobolomyces roseus]